MIQVHSTKYFTSHAILSNLSLSRLRFIDKHISSQPVLSILLIHQKTIR